jgi:hypothetical protein
MLLCSGEVKGLLDGLLQRDVDKRLGCCGQGAEEVSKKCIFGFWDGFLPSTRFHQLELSTSEDY